MVLGIEKGKGLIVLLILLILVGAVMSGCLRKQTKPGDVVTQKLPQTAIAKNYVLDGPIYSTSADYYKGGLKELTDWVPHLKDTGFKTIYLLPVWSENSYTPDDYYKINPKIGTEADMKNLVEKVHNNDMKIFFDLVTA